MSRRWWIASGVLIAVLAIVSVVVTRQAQQGADEPVDASNVFTVYVDGPEPWWSTPARAAGAILVGVGVLLAVAVVSYSIGRRRTAATVAHDEPGAPAEDGTEPGAGQRRRSRARTAVLAVCAALVVGGLVIAWPRGGPESYRLTNGAAATGWWEELAPSDNVAAVPAPLASAEYGVVVVPGTVPYVQGLPFAVARESLEQAGFSTIVVVGPDGELALDEVRPGSEVLSLDPSPGSTPEPGTRVVVRLR